MGVFSELDLENQQTELDGHDSRPFSIRKELYHGRIFRA